MTATDILLIAALVTFTLAWWLRALPGRGRVLLASVLVALAAGIAGVLDDRWQNAAGAAVALLLLAGLGIGRLRKHGGGRTPFVSGTLVGVLAALAVAAIVLFPVRPLPKPGGASAVGVRTFEVVDVSRKGVLHASADQPRRLLVRVWYPAGETGGLTRRPYFTREEAQSTGRSLGEAFKFPAFFTYLRHVRTNSYEDAPLVAGASGLPVVIYSHGYTSFLGQNTVLMEELASHGYVVFSLQHTYDSGATLFPDGTVAPMDPELLAPPAGGGKPEQAQIDALAGKNLDARLNGQLAVREQGLAKGDRITRSGVIWAADRIFLHDQLQAGAVPDAIKPIAAAGDLTRVGEMGMSFGGATSGTVCMTDKRCAAGINLDGADFPFQAFDAAMPVPFLMFHSDMRNIYQAMGVAPPGGKARPFNDFSYETFANAGSDPKVHRLQLKDSRHLGLSDFSLFIRRPVRDALLGATPSRVMIGAQNDFVRGFFDRYLRGRASGFPAAQTKAYGEWILPADNGEVRAWWDAKPAAERAAIEARIAGMRAAR